MTEPDIWRRSWSATRQAGNLFLRDVGRGLVDVGHNMLALLGLAVVATLVFALGRPDLRKAVETHAFDWLLERHEASAEPAPPTAADAMELVAAIPTMATDPSGLNRQQAAVANWLARRYRVAPEPVSRLVQEAWQVGQRVGLDPTLILAIMAIESSFNPFAQSPVGAQGLMQVMTRVHNDKYEAFGGHLAAFDPVTNLRVGVQVLKECIGRAGGLEAGLRFYVGAGNADDGGYASRVLAEQQHLNKVVHGQNVPVTVAFVPTPTTAPAATPAPVAASGSAETPAPEASNIGPAEARARVADIWHEQFEAVAKEALQTPLVTAKAAHEVDFKRQQIAFAR